jgi:hypothetical protein
MRVPSSVFSKRGGVSCCALVGSVARSDGHRALTRGADRLLAPCPADPPLALPWAEHETMKQVIEAAGVPIPRSRPCA